jgi:hypothetical protein
MVLYRFFPPASEPSVKPIAFGRLRAGAPALLNSLFTVGLIGSNFHKTAQRGFDSGALGGLACGLHRQLHQLVVNVDVGPHRIVPFDV